VDCTGAGVLLDERYDRADPLDEVGVRRFIRPGMVGLYAPSHLVAQTGV
jgi:hypothetical protein